MNSTSKVRFRKKLRFESPDIKYDNSDTGTDENVGSDENYEMDQYAEESSSDKYDEDSDIKLSDSSESEDDITDNDSDEN